MSQRAPTALAYPGVAPSANSSDPTANRTAIHHARACGAHHVEPCRWRFGQVFAVAAGLPTNHQAVRAYVIDKSHGGTAADDAAVAVLPGHGASHLLATIFPDAPGVDQRRS